MLRFGFESVETMFTFPVADPPVVGVKSTENDALWPLFNVMGKASPLIENPVPLAAACEIVTAVPPVLVNVSV
jgi:hypothetical protein